MRKQSYSNHRRYIFLFHIVIYGLCTVTLIGSVVNLVNSLHVHSNLYSASLLVVASIILFLLAFITRQFAVRLQDRIIRAEENFRHYHLTGKPLDQRLQMRQIIALRFAPEDEFITLAKEAADRHLTEEQIKKEIKRWKGDYHRI